MSIEKRKAESDNDEGQPDNKKVQKDALEEKQESIAETETQGTAGDTQDQESEAAEQLTESYDEFTHEEWVQLLKKTLEGGEEENITKLFEQYLTQYVNDGEQWVEYIKWMMKGDDVEKMDKKRIESSFFKVLTKVYNVKLWRLYLHYVELINPITPDNGEKARNIVLKAYNFAIETVGHDFFSSNEIWGDYLKYLYVWQAVNPNEASTREDLIRKALKNMISYPSLNLEENWNIFTKFETDLNLNKSRKVISDCKNDYLKLKGLNNEIIGLTKSIKKVDERKHSLRQIRRWNSWINWEKENKLKLTEEEANKRINYVYNLSIQYCYLMPEAWFNFSNYLVVERNNAKLGLEVLKDGIKVNPYSLILRYQLSNHYEGANDLEKIKETWLDLIRRVENSAKKDDRLITYCYSILMRVVKRISNIKEIRMIFKLARQFKGITWNIFYQYAMIEYYNNEIKIANRTFALGMQYFSTEISFVQKYLQFLIDIKDMTNFKKTIELSLESFKENQSASKILYRMYFQVEQEFGDINSINNLVKRYSQAFGKNSPFELIKDGLKSEEDGFDGIRELDEYKQENANATGNGSSNGNGNGHSSGHSSGSAAKADKDAEHEDGGRGGRGEKEGEGNKDKDSEDDDVQITSVIDGLKEDSSESKNQASGPDGGDITAKLYSFLQALPQDAAYQEQVKNLSIGQILEFFRSVDNANWQPYIYLHIYLAGNSPTTLITSNPCESRNVPGASPSRRPEGGRGVLKQWLPRVWGVPPYIVGHLRAGQLMVLLSLLLLC